LGSDRTFFALRIRRQIPTPETADNEEIAVDKLQGMLLEQAQYSKVSTAERRRESRTLIARPVYIRPADPSETSFEEVQTTTDFSNFGLHFVTAQKDYYREGMQLYMIPVLGCLNFECLGEVVRLEPLPDERWGIAVKLLRIGKPIVDERTVRTSSFRVPNVLGAAKTWNEMSPDFPARIRSVEHSHSRIKMQVSVKNRQG
jgi:hypothetical protein